ncbi:MAG TPA: glycosyltransferase [Steroidobacteraceae bacterium]|nr:glycosyltransferase [Steroidobacteraceae bacterium]
MQPPSRADCGSVVFYDPVCQKPYDTDSVRQAAAGGTEASVSRIADSIGALVMQHNRTEAHGRYLPVQRVPGVTHVIVNRDSRALRRARELYPEARLYLWVHHHFPLGSKLFLRFASTVPFLREMGVTIVCVSNQQRLELEKLLRLLDLQDRLSTVTIYNPVDDSLAPDGTAVDDRKLVFLSAPNKGLKFTLDAFRELRRRMPDLRLAVGDPGYRVKSWPPIEGVEYLGPLPQSQIHAQVRSALCVFFPNFVYPETFGLVLAESKALGTPCLTSDCGAAAEILADPRQLMPVRSAEILYEDLFRSMNMRWRAWPALLAARAGLFDRYVERIRAWRGGERPVVRPDPRFKLPNVAEEWRKLLSQA